jgi:hypothetical protein
MQTGHDEQLPLDWPVYYPNGLHGRMRTLLRPGDAGYDELARGDYAGALRANGIDPNDLARQYDRHIARRRAGQEQERRDR